MNLRSEKLPSGSIEFVTAFYPGPSKHTDATYDHWARQLFRATRHSILHFFVPSSCVADRFSRLGAGRNVRFRMLCREDLPALQMRVAWDTQVDLDPERATHQNSSHLYVVWNSKVGLAAQVAKSSVSRAPIFWIDAGYVRSIRTQRAISRFPSRQQAGLIAAGGLHFLAVEPFTETELRNRSTALPDDFRGLVRIGGGMFGGISDSWSRFLPAYEQALAKWSATGHFVGKDQNLFAALILRRPDLSKAWVARRRLGGLWFELPTSIGRRQEITG